MSDAPEPNREALRRMFDALADEDVPRVRELLVRLRLERSLAEAPIDDEPETAEEREAVREAREAIARGDVIPHEELMRELGLDE